jgi:hypothetical protein
MAFHVGQRVVCVDLSPRGKYLHHAVWVRDAFDARPYGFDQDGLLLEEIINPVLDYLAPAGPVRIEQFFLAIRFRPLRTTSVEVFTRMLEPAELVDA